MGPGDVVWVDLGDAVGREQRGRRPAVVVSSSDHLAAADALVSVVPCTSRDQGWINHIRLDVTGGGLDHPTFALTEQVRTVARDRVVGTAGLVSPGCLAEIMAWIHRWLAPPPEGYPPRI